MAASIMRRYLAQKHTSWSQLCRKRETVRMATRLRMHSAARSTESMAGFHLTWRGVVRVSGRDKVDFLQGLVTNDVTQLCLNKDGIQYAMMLNVQGRVQYDLLLYHNSKLCDDVCFLIECDADLKEDFIKTIKKYKIRKKLDISDASSEYQVWSVLSDNDPNQPEVKVKDSLKSTTENPGAGQASACCFPDALVCLPDPRVPQFGHRVIFRSGEATINMTQKPEDYHEARYMWGIPEGPGDLPPGSCLPLESNLELMNGVSFSKGCYIGQELTARTYHTGVIRKRLVPLLFQNPHEDVASESQINTENGKNAGKFRSLARMHGLGLLRLSFLHEQLSVSSNQGCKINLTSYIPGWWPDGVAKNVS